MMKEILNEILENNPELEKEKEQLGKVIDELEENNPKIIISNEFKKSLKSRIGGLINLKQNKKTNFVILIIPVFSFIFIVVGFLYYFDKFDFIGNGKNIDLKDITKINEEDFQTQEIEEIGKMSQEALKEEVQENNTVKDKNISKKQNDISSNETSDIIIKEDLENPPIDNSTISKSAILKNYFKQTNNEITGPVSDTFSIIEDNIEDNQVMDLFEALGEEYPELSGVSEEDSQDTGVSQKRMGIFDGNSAGGEFQIMEDQSLIENDMQFDFKSFCEQELGEYSGSGVLEKCIINKKECLASEFLNGTCEFSEIK